MIHRDSQSNTEKGNKGDPQTYAIIGAAIAVQEYLGTGFLEAVYQDCLEEEFKRRNIPYIREAPIHINYKGTVIKSTYRADFLCFDSVIVELKALTELSSTEESQILNYLKATRLHRALLLNFGVGPLERKRYVL